LPVKAPQAKQMIACARSARFGRGEQTLMDLSVRDTWKVTPDQVTLTGLDWDAILTEVRDELGLSARGAAAGRAARAAGVREGSVLPAAPGLREGRHDDRHADRAREPVPAAPAGAGGCHPPGDQGLIAADLFSAALATTRRSDPSSAATLAGRGSSVSSSNRWAAAYTRSIRTMVIRSPSTSYRPGKGRREACGRRRGRTRPEAPDRQLRLPRRG
jgi:hypothetical protein